MVNSISVHQNILQIISETGSWILFCWGYGETQALFLLPQMMNQKQLENWKDKGTCVQEKYLKRPKLGTKNKLIN